MSKFFCILTIFLSTQIYYSYGQYKERDTLAISIFSGNTEYPKMVDSLIIYNVIKKKVDTVITSISMKEKEIRVIYPSGFYKIILKAQGYKFTNDFIAVCTFCENKIKAYCFLENDKDAILNMLYLPPYYIGEITQLRNDFQQSISKKELDRFKHLNNFKISFFIIKNGQLSNIELNTNQLNSKDKKLITKYLNNLKNWNHGIVNFKKDQDNYYSIQSDQIFN